MTRALQKLIHVGCRALGLDEDTRRGLQLMATGKSSLRDMDEDDLNNVLMALKSCGFKPGPRGKALRPPAPRADVRLCHVLWRLLAEKGAVKKPGRAGLNAFIRARFEATWGAVPLDIDTMRDARQIGDVVTALKDWCRREGVDTGGGRSGGIAPNGGPR